MVSGKGLLGWAGLDPGWGEPPPASLPVWLHVLFSSFWVASGDRVCTWSSSHSHSAVCLVELGAGVRMAACRVGSPSPDITSCCLRAGERTMYCASRPGAGRSAMPFQKKKESPKQMADRRRQTMQRFTCVRVPCLGAHDRRFLRRIGICALVPAGATQNPSQKSQTAVFVPSRSVPPSGASESAGRPFPFSFSCCRSPARCFASRGQRPRTRQVKVDQTWANCGSLWRTTYLPPNNRWHRVHPATP